MRLPTVLLILAQGFALAVLLAGPLRRAAAEVVSGDAGASPLPPAWVDGFERFARHDEITTETAGRLLLSELSCTACHRSGGADKSLAAKGGPSLVGLGDRIDRGWVERFLRDPAALHPTSTMPNLVAAIDAGDRERVVAALGAFLGSLRKPLPQIKGSGANPVPHEFWMRGDAERGGQLYHQVGCVACHAADDDHDVPDRPPSQLDELVELLAPEELEELGLAAALRDGPVQPLPSLAEKYSLRSLSLFLLDPHAVRAGQRMPNLKLEVVEAADLAAYLMRRRGSDIVPVGDFSTRAADVRIDDAIVAQGRRWFHELGCAHCHESGTEPPESLQVGRVAPPPLKMLRAAAERGCLVEMNGRRGARDRHGRSTPGVPRYALDGAQREAIVAALASLDAEREPAEQLLVSLLQQNCLACHQRGDMGGVPRDRAVHFETIGHEDLGDEGRLPPPLTGVEHKLQPDWLTRVLRGNGDIRPHLVARMPKYQGGTAKRLVDSFASVAAASPRSSTSMPAGWPEKADPRQLDAGRQLVDTACVQCHRFRGESLPGVIGIDLAGVDQRVEPAWFHDFVFDPGSLKHRTRMPTFFPDGKSQNAELLEGDPHRQIAAMWGYLSDLSGQPLPPQIERARGEDFELRPEDRPILLRGFMRQAGPHAIAVGFPQGIHYSLDADRLRLATAWSGRFLDAQGTWFIRAAPPADPLGDDETVIQPAEPFLFPDDVDPLAGRPQWLGFQLGDDGVPTFRYRLGDLVFADRIVPAAGEAPGKRGLVRTIRIAAGAAAGGQLAGLASVDPGDIRYRLHAGERLEPVPAEAGQRAAMQSDSGVLVSVDASLGQAARLETIRGLQSWIVPLEALRPGDDDQRRIVEIQYRW